MNGPKKVFIDIEVSPIHGWAYGRYQTNLIAVSEEPYIFCMAYRWEGEKKINITSIRHHRKPSSHDDKPVMRDIWNVLDEAHIIVAHNGDGFDLKKINARLLIHGFKPPSPYMTIDTLKIVRKISKSEDNSLNAWGKRLGIGQKMKHDGWDMHRGCIEGNEKHWDMMERYNKQDIVVLQGLYDHLLPWIPNHPNMNLYQGTTHCCPNCGSANIRKKGFRKLETEYNYTRTMKRQRYSCKDCGKYFSGETVKGGFVVR